MWEVGLGPLREAIPLLWSHGLAAGGSHPTALTGEGLLCRSRACGEHSTRVCGSRARNMNMLTHTLHLRDKQEVSGGAVLRLLPF